MAFSVLQGAFITYIPHVWLMENSRQLALKKWVEQLNDRRRKYFFEKYLFKKSREPFSLNSFWNSFKNDVLFISRQIYIAAKQLKAFGPHIQKEYGVPFYVQFYRLLYLTLVVKSNAEQFRKRLLFKNSSWYYVKQYDYGQTHTQIQLARNSFPDEIAIIEDKFRFYKHCKNNEIKTPEVLAVFSNGKQIYPENRPFVLPSEDLFIKERMGGKGNHAKKFSYSQPFYGSANQEKYTKQELLKFVIDESQRYDLIVQRSLVNHDQQKPFTNGALSTCRIVTVKKPDQSDIFPLFTVLRMPCGSKDVDNYAQGGLLSTINIETGMLGRAVTYLPYKGRFEFDEHPDTHQKISGFRLPLWREMLEFAIESHKQFRSLAVGWDVCYSEKGIYLIEGNLRWGSSLYECPEQKPFRETCYPAVYDALISKYSNDE